MDDRKECGFGESDFSVGHPVQHESSAAELTTTSIMVQSTHVCHFFRMKTLIFHSMNLQFILNAPIVDLIW